MTINFTINPLILTKNYHSEDLNERDKKRFLTLTSLKYLVKKTKISVNRRKY